MSSSLVSRRTLRLLIGLLLAVVLWGAPIGTLSGLDVTQVTGPHTDGTIYTMDFSVVGLLSTVAGPDISGASGFGYLNVMRNTEWLIQNEPVPLLADLLGQNNSLWFSTPDSDFTDMSVVLNDAPFASTPVVDAGWSLFASSGGTDPWGLNDAEGESGPALPLGEPPPAVATIEGYLRGGVPDLKQLEMECGPTSTLNSLLWLVEKYKLPKDNLPKKPDGSLDQEAMLKQLAKAMNPAWDENTPVNGNSRGYPGLSGNQLEEGKKKFIADTKLPLTVHGGKTDPNAVGAKAFDFVKKELKRGQDVEFLIFWEGGGGHWVTVVGYSDGGKDMKTLIVHDPDAKAGNHYWKLKDDGTFTAPKGTAGTAIAESPVPEPHTFALVLVVLAGLAVRRRRVGTPRRSRVF